MSAICWIGAVLGAGVLRDRRPAHPSNVTFYNLRPHNLSTNIIEKDSADALGDIFFYITDRLSVPYACRNSPPGKVPFMCEGFQKRLQTDDQVYAQLVVEVDSTYGGCESGDYSCSQYADCNPTSSAGTIEWHCDCHTSSSAAVGPPPQLPPPPAWATPTPHRAHHRHHQHPVAASARGAPSYWGCSAALAERCPIYGDARSCAGCASDHPAELAAAGCTPTFVAKSCGSDYHVCERAVEMTGCALPPASTSAACQTCVQTPATEAANCSVAVIDYLCRRPVLCNATGMLEVTTRYCGATVPATGLCTLCADDCGGIWDHWKSEIAQLGGIWYSTTKETNCVDPSAPGCTWRVVKEVKTINATCANANVHRLVETRGEKCFQQCAQPSNTTSDCWILCFFETVLARDPLQLDRKTGGTPITGVEIKRAWEAAFSSDDPAEGGCPPVPLETPKAAVDTVLATAAAPAKAPLPRELR